MLSRHTVKTLLATIKSNDLWCEMNACYIDGVLMRRGENAHIRFTLENEKAIQNCCVYGYVLPDRCRYNSITGCDCGAYPPSNVNAKETKK